MWDSKVYACGHKEWLCSSASRDLYEWATKDTPDLCPSCRVLLLQQRLNYFTSSREKLGDFPARQLLLQVIDAKSYAPAETFLSLLNQWASGATQRLDGSDEEASREVARVVAALDHVRDGALIMELVQMTRRKNHLCRVQQEQNAFFDVRWASLLAADSQHKGRIYEAIDPALMCAQMSGAAAGAGAAGPEEKKPGDGLSLDNTLDTVLQARPWNPQVGALRGRLQEALKRGDFKATFDEEMTNAEEVLDPGLDRGWRSPG